MFTTSNLIVSMRIGRRVKKIISTLAVVLAYDICKHYIM